MPPSNKLPNSLRYLRGRLRILKRPMVWGSASAMVLAVLLFSEYWKHPEWFNASEEYTSTSGVASLDGLSNDQSGAAPSQEDSAIGVDIDSLPVLLNDLNLDNPTQTGQATPTGETASEPVVLGQPTPAATQTPPTSAAPEASRRNPFAATAQTPRLFNLNLPGIDRVNSSAAVTSARSSGGLNSDFASTLDLFATPTQPATNPLRTALQQYPPTTGSQPETQPTSQRSPNAPTQAAANEPFSSGGRLEPNQPIPAGLLPPSSQVTSPPMGSTGYTLPPTLRTVPSSSPYSSNGQPTIPGLPSAPQIAPPPLAPGSVGRSTLQTPTYGSNPANSANPYNLPSNTAPNPAQTQSNAPAEPAPFSAPRSIGGGEINTFANP